MFHFLFIIYYLLSICNYSGDVEHGFVLLKAMAFFDFSAASRRVHVEFSRKFLHCWTKIKFSDIVLALRFSSATLGKIKQLVDHSLYYRNIVNI